MNFIDVKVLILFVFLATGLAQPIQSEDADVVLETNRLPNNTLPERYTVELTTNVHTGDRSFNGTVNIDIRAVEESREITVHARQLSGFVCSIIRTDTSTTEVPTALTYIYKDQTEFLVLSAPGLTLPKNSTWRLTISYNGTLRTDLGGFYITSYRDENQTAHYIATTQFESTDARHAFPCYDEPAKRANYTIIINHDPSYFAKSNMPVDSNRSTSGRTVFQTLKSMPTYVVGFIVSDFKYSEGVLNGLPQRVYSQPGTENQQDFALITGLRMYQSLSKYFDSELPLRQIDMIAVPQLSDIGMENWGLITFDSAYLLYDPQRSPEINEIAIVRTIAHEYTHQWFGDKVTIQWWSYLWLKEGIANLFQYVATDMLYPDWDYYQIRYLEDFVVALTDDANENARPMTYYTENLSKIYDLYDYVSYQKAASVLYMWQQALTATVFRRGLLNYLQSNQYSAADENDFFNGIQSGVDEEQFLVPANIKDMISSWSQQSNYPILTVERNYENGAFTVTQQVFFSNATISAAANKTWYIPFNFATKSNPDFRNTTATHYMLKTRDVSVNNSNVSKDDWLILNKQSTGFYRINYDENNWNLIINGLLENPFKIHALNRAQLMNDAYVLGTSGRLKQAVFLKLLTYLPQEDHFAAWYNFYTAILELNQYLFHDNKYSKFQAYVGKLTSRLYNRLGARDEPGQPHFLQSFRRAAISMACLAELPSCLQDTTNRIEDFVYRNIPIESNLDDIFCSGLKRANNELFNAIYNLFLESEDPSFRNTLISSLGCSESASQIKKFIESSIDMSNNLRDYERTNLILATLSGSSVGFNQSIEFLRNNWDAYANLTSGSGSTNQNPAQSDLITLSTFVVNQQEKEAVNSLVNLFRSAISSSLNETIISNIEHNLDWMNKNRDPIMNWIEEYLNNES